MLLGSVRKFLVVRKILGAEGALFRFEMKSRKKVGREERKGKEGKREEEREGGNRRAGSIILRT